MPLIAYPTFSIKILTSYHVPPSVCSLHACLQHAVSPGSLSSGVSGHGFKTRASLWSLSAWYSCATCFCFSLTNCGENYIPLKTVADVIGPHLVLLPFYRQLFMIWVLWIYADTPRSKLSSTFLTTITNQPCPFCCKYVLRMLDPKMATRPRLHSPSLLESHCVFCLPPWFSSAFWDFCCIVFSVVYSSGASWWVGLSWKF